MTDSSGSLVVLEDDLHLPRVGLLADLALNIQGLLDGTAPAFRFNDESADTLTSSPCRLSIHNIQTNYSITAQSQNAGGMVHEALHCSEMQLWSGPWKKTRAKDTGIVTTIACNRTLWLMASQEV